MSFLNYYSKRLIDFLILGKLLVIFIVNINNIIWKNNQVNCKYKQINMFLSIKNIPKVSWSSEKPLNIKPKISTFLFLCFGLTLFGLGEGLLIVSFAGASPWSVLAQGISLNVDLSIGTITLFLSIGVLTFWLPLNQKPGIGTILNALIVAVMIDISIALISTPENYISQLLLAFIAVLTVGLGGGKIGRASCRERV